ncbi:putative Permease [Streptococcus sp. DD10]|uniref:AI-2E family transporter n=1 Tax=Streptococcus sp. DD10 TaxID=1777878 RepID=UPI000797231C|nr:AI-2E family transporter [Streptococcus sp. DD10]KXT74367.1 putative Permease [Streptococcus sp. DD10]
MKKIRKSYQLIIFTGLVLAFVLYIGTIWQGVQSLLSVFFPIILGGILAFIFNVPMKKIEQVLAKWKLPQASRRSLALFLEVVFLLLILGGMVWVIVPTLTTVASQLTTTVNKVVPQLVTWVQDSGLVSSSQVTELTQQLQSSGLMSRAVSFLSSLTGNVSSILSNLFTVFMSLFLMFAMLGSKEQLRSMTIRLLKVSLPEKAVERFSYIGKVLVETYDKFLMGQLIEAVIVGILVFLAYTVTRLPYAALTGVLAGVLSFIPYIGPFSACVLGAVFIFTVSPMQALLSIVVFQVIQLIEGNLIYPRVVGQSVGLPSLFTLAAALIGGNLFGLLGMIFFTPIFAVIYRLVKEWVVEREERLS